jgi:hypothetical protein
VGGRDLSWFDASLLSDLSDDAVLFVESGGEAAQHAIYLRKLDGSAAVRLGDGVSGKLSPDGKRVVVIPADLSPRLLLMPTGAGDSITLPLGDVVPVWAGWFPDGKRILVEGRQPGHGNRLYVHTLDSGQRPVGPEGMGVAPAAISADGSQIAAVGPDGRIALLPVGDGALTTVSAPGLVPVRFDGGSLLAFRPGEVPAHVLRIDLASGKTESAFDLLPQDPAGVTGIFSVLAAKQTAYGYRRVLSDLYLLDGVR